LSPTETRHAGVMTVLGPTDRADLGFVLPHEHIIEEQIRKLTIENPACMLSGS